MLRYEENGPRTHCSNGDKHLRNNIEDMLHAVSSIPHIPFKQTRILDLYAFYFHCFTGFVVLDENLCVTACNPAACLLFGKRDSDLIGKPFDSLIGQEAKVQVNTCLERLRKNGKFSAVTVPYQCPGAKPAPLHIYAFMYKEARGRHVTACLLSTQTAASPIESDTETRHARMAELYITQRKELHQALKYWVDTRIHLKAPTSAQTVHSQSAHKLLKLIERERHEMGSALHDQFGQLLAALKMNFENFLLDMDNIDASTTLKADKIILQINELISVTRNMSHWLRADCVNKIGLKSAIQGLLDEFVLKTDISCKFFTKKVFDQINSEAGIALFRILQESLTNILKHARATQVWVSLLMEGPFACLSIEDNGIGFDPEKIFCRDLEPGSPMGVLIMRERAEQLGGELEIESEPGQGTLVIAKIPVHPIQV